MKQTPNLNLNLLSIYQSGKELAINKNFLIIDFYLGKTVNNIVDVLPENALQGETYIFEQKIYISFENSWIEILPAENMEVYCLSSNQNLKYINNKWE